MKKKPIFFSLYQSSLFCVFERMAVSDMVLQILVSIEWCAPSPPQTEGTICFLQADIQPGTIVPARYLTFRHILFPSHSYIWTGGYLVPVATLYRSFGSGMFIPDPDPDFYPSWIPDLGSPIPNPTTATKEVGEKIVVLHFIVATNIIKPKII
jgi:hypothetical protein